MKDIDPKDIPGALSDMTCSVREDFSSDRIVVTVNFHRAAYVSLAAEMLDGTHGDVVETLARAAEQATAILRDDVRKALGVGHE